MILLLIKIVIYIIYYRCINIWQNNKLVKKETDVNKTIMNRYENEIVVKHS